MLTTHLNYFRNFIKSCWVKKKLEFCCGGGFFQNKKETVKGWEGNSLVKHEACKVRTLAFAPDKEAQLQRMLSNETGKPKAEDRDIVGTKGADASDTSESVKVISNSNKDAGELKTVFY